MTEGGFKKRGSIAVSKIDASGFYYLNVEGEAGHALKCILQVRLGLSPAHTRPPPGALTPAARRLHEDSAGRRSCRRRQV